jgi:hypothetical protein
MKGKPPESHHVQERAHFIYRSWILRSGFDEYFRGVFLVLDFNTIDLVEFFGNEPVESDGYGIYRFIAEDQKGFQLMLYLNAYDDQVHIELRHAELERRLVVITYEEVDKIVVFKDDKFGEGFSVFHKNKKLPSVVVTFKNSFQIEI